MKKTISIGISLIFILEIMSCNVCFAKRKKDSNLITNVFFETDIREALRDISAQSGVSIIPDNTVQGIVTLTAKNMPLEECLNMVLMGGGYTYRKIDDYYLVGAPVPENPGFSHLTETKHIKPNYIKAEDVPLFLPEYFTDYIHVNKAINMLAVTASPQIIKRIESDIAKIDVPPKQIMIQALITDFSKGVTKDFGLNYQGTFNNKDEGIKNTLSGAVEMTDVVGTFSYAATNELTRTILLKLKALEKKGKVRVRANPRIITLDGQEANIFIGKEQYYSIVSGPVNYPYTTLEAIKAGITLKITPYIAENKDITIEISPEVSDVSESEAGLPLIVKRQISTKVRVKNGETVIIGGLTHQNEFEKITRFPILGYIPIINLFFMHKNKIVDETEVVVFITPNIVSDDHLLPIIDEEEKKEIKED